MSAKYNKKRPPVPASARRQAEIEAGHKCSIAHCNERTSLALHHIDGDRENNRIENLILLCGVHHPQADKGDIDRKSLREYKRLNRERLGLGDSFQLPQPYREKYLRSMLDRLEQELLRYEGSPLQKSTRRFHISPLIKPYKSSVFLPKGDEEQVSIDAFINKHNHLLLLGNGGSGKTTTLLDWRLSQTQAALESDELPIPVYVRLTMLTPLTNLQNLTRAAIGRHGISVSHEQLEALLIFGHLVLVLDSLNEINEIARKQGAIEDTVNFANTYPESQIVITSRYITTISDIDLPKVEMTPWDQNRVKDYLLKRLGAELGAATFATLGDNLDFDWMQGSSLAGLSSNPLTLWMIATNAEAENTPPEQETGLVSSLVKTFIDRTPERFRLRLPPKILFAALESFAYLMVDHGYVLSMPYYDAIELIATTIEQLELHRLRIKELSTMGLLDSLIATGIIYRDEESILWLHQVVQEVLSIAYSEKRFKTAHQLSSCLHCPVCGYWPDDWYYETDGDVWGKCSSTPECHDYIITIPVIPDDCKLRESVRFIDHTRAPKGDPDHVYVPYNLFDDGWARLMPDIRLLATVLSYSQSVETELISREAVFEAADTPQPLAELLIWMLIEIGALVFEHSENTTTIHVHPLPSNPSQRLEEFVLVTIQDLTLEELEENDPEDRMTVTLPGHEGKMEERRRKNLPIYNSYPFSREDKERVFRIAQKTGGRVVRKWGGYEELIAEFPGKAWDFTGYNIEE